MFLLVLLSGPRFKSCRGRRQYPKPAGRWHCSLGDFSPLWDV